MAKQETILTGGGGVGAKKSAEDFKNAYFVKAITQIDNLTLLADLPVFDEEHKVGITFEMDELLSLGYTGVTTGAPMQAMNRVFNTLEIPYIAGTINRDDVLKVKVTRYGDEYDYTKYSTTKAGRPSYKKEEKMVDGVKTEVKVQDGFVAHEDAPEGLEECLKNWLTEVAIEFDIEFIEKLGLDRKMTELGLIED